MSASAQLISCDSTLFISHAVYLGKHDLVWHMGHMIPYGFVASGVWCVCVCVCVRECLRGWGPEVSAHLGACDRSSVTVSSSVGCCVCVCVCVSECLRELGQEVMLTCG